MASFNDILIETLDTTFAQEQLKKMEDELQKVIQGSQKDPTLAVKTANLSALPQQIKGLKAWLEQQAETLKKQAQNPDDTKMTNEPKKPETTVAALPELPASKSQQQLNDPVQAKEKVSALDQLRMKNLTKK